MAQAITHFDARVATDKGLRIAVAAWVLTAFYYFYQYALRSAPAVMMPELSNAFGLSPIAVASLVGLFYYGYSPFSLVAGAAALVGIGALLFATGNTQLASLGRFLQGAGGVFALVGAIYIATRNFSPAKAATLIGATQMFGMAGGSAGQFVVGPLIGSGVAWSNFWIGMGVIGLVIGIALFFLIPSESSTQSGGGLRAVAGAFATVFKNPQSILCGLISGLMFIPTTIFDMIW